MRDKKTIIILILILVIGFASVSTTLVINGVIGVSNKKEDFNIIFTNAKLDNIEKKEFIDSETKKTINYETNKLTTINETTTLEYDVTNTSRIYDADVSITCNIVDDAGNEATSEYVSMEYTPASMTIEAGKTKIGSITTKLIKGITEDKSIKVKCTLNATATERDSLGEKFIDPDKFGGTLMAYSNVNKIWADNIRNNTTKIVFENRLNPHETTEELTFDISESQDGSVMAYAVSNDASLYDLYIQSDGKIMANENSSYYFSYFSKITTIEGLEYFDTSNVTDMKSMFYKCSSLITLDLSNFVTSNVTDMSYMFNDCSNLTSLDLSNFDTSKVSNMRNLLCGCNNLTSLNLANLDTSNVTDMTDMFCKCSSLITLDLSNFNTSKVTNMSEMFDECTNLETLNLANWDTSNVTYMSSMFNKCSSLIMLDLSNFNTGKVTRMSNMFQECTNLETLNLANWDTSNVTNMFFMFYGCRSLITLDLSDFNTNKVTNTSNMFQGCINLTTLNISSFDISNVTNVKNTFSSMPSNAIIKVKDATVQNWVLTSSNGRPTSWTTDNVIIAQQEA